MVCLAGGHKTPLICLTAGRPATKPAHRIREWRVLDNIDVPGKGELLQEIFACQMIPNMQCVVLMRLDF